MKHTESEAFDLIDACNENINSGDVNTAGSYDEGSVMPFCGCWMEHQGHR